ncbi:MAG: ketoacyl-ACP synthase III [Rhodospirillaceae bacterium]|nr:ketoacyl-ACP synthase III [Rhodospirillaceae bacterium]
MPARIADIEVYLPPRVETNEDLCGVFDRALVERVGATTGIVARRVCGDGMTALDMAELAARPLLERCGNPAVQYLIFCTQSPDHFLPTGACILQSRLGLGEQTAAFDINQGCSGYIYALDLADALIASGRADRVLLLTGDTYTRFIHPRDHASRLVFGDGASATLVERAEAASGCSLGPFVLRTDGQGADNLIVPAGGARLPRSAETAVEQADAGGSVRSLDNLYMNGREIFLFATSALPAVIREALAAVGAGIEDIDWFVPHQANRFVLHQVAARAGIPLDRLVEHYAEVGNTVSTTIPLALKAYADDGRIRRGQRLLLVGYGVGYSWGACHAVF